MQATRIVTFLFAFLVYFTPAKCTSEDIGSTSFASLSSLTVMESEIDKMMRSTFEDVLVRTPELKGSLADKLAEMAAFEVSHEEFEEMHDEGLEDQVLELVQNYIDSDDADKTEILSQKLAQLLKKITLLTALANTKENAALVEIASKLTVTIVSLSKIIIEEITFFKEEMQTEMLLKIQEAQELYRFLKQQLMDKFEYIEVYDKVLSQLRLIYELNLKQIIEAIFRDSSETEELNINAVLYSLRFASIFKAMHNLQLTQYSDFEKPPIFMCLKLLFKKYLKSLESHSLSKSQIVFTKKVLHEIFTYLLQKEESTDLIFTIISTYLQMHDKTLIYINNICSFFITKFHESGLPIDQYKSENHYFNKMLLQHSVLDVLYQLGVCGVNPLTKTDIAALTENLEILLNIPANYFVYKRIYPKILYEKTADAAKDYQFFMMMYSFVTRMKIRDEMSSDKFVNNDFNSFIDMLYEEKIDKSEPLWFDIDQNYILLKFAAAFQQKSDGSMIEIPEMDPKMFDTFIEFLNSTNFTTFKEFVEALFSNIFNEELAHDHKFEFVRLFNDFVFDNQIIELTVKRQSSSSPKFAH